MNTTPHQGSPTTRSPSGAAPPSEPARPAARAFWPALTWLQRGLGLLLALVLLGIGYGAGRVQGVLSLGKQTEQHAGDLAVWARKLAALEAERDLLLARRSLALVALALDRRNFGVAESHRRAALDALARPTLNGMAELTSLTPRVRELRLDVDPDPGAKREQVIAVAEALDQVSVKR